MKGVGEVQEACSELVIAPELKGTGAMRSTIESWGSTVANGIGCTLRLHWQLEGSLGGTSGTGLVRGHSHSRILIGFTLKCALRKYQPLGTRTSTV